MPPHGRSGPLPPGAETEPKHLKQSTVTIETFGRSAVTLVMPL
jgi:hypothetical protein